MPPSNLPNPNLKSGSLPLRTDLHATSDTSDLPALLVLSTCKTMSTGPSLTPFVPGIILFKDYPIRYAGCTFNSRMTIIKLGSGKIIIHSPCKIDDALKAEIESLGPVGYIVAPGNFHHFHVPSCQKAFPSAKTLICPGIDVKRPDIQYDGILDDKVNEEYSDEIDQVVLRGNRMINEVAFYHRPSRTLILVDSIELIGDRTPGTNWLLRLWWKYILGMWNKPKPAPEYQMGWKHKAQAKRCMEQILAWNFERAIIAHGENIENDAKSVVREAWHSVLRTSGSPEDLTPRQRSSMCC